MFSNIVNKKEKNNMSVFLSRLLFGVVSFQLIGFNVLISNLNANEKEEIDIKSIQQYNAKNNNTYNTNKIVLEITEGLLTQSLKKVEDLSIEIKDLEESIKKIEKEKKDVELKYKNVESFDLNKIEYQDIEVSNIIKNSKGLEKLEELDKYQKITESLLRLKKEKEIIEKLSELKRQKYEKSIYSKNENEKKESLKKISELNNLLIQKTTELQIKTQQINALKNEINLLQNKIDTLKEENQKLSLELDYVKGAILTKIKNREYSKAEDLFNLLKNYLPIETQTNYTIFFSILNNFNNEELINVDLNLIKDKELLNLLLLEFFTQIGKTKITEPNQLEIMKVKIEKNNILKNIDKNILVSKILRLQGNFSDSIRLLIKEIDMKNKNYVDELNISLNTIKGIEDITFSLVYKQSKEEYTRKLLNLNME
jgi:hypothetical protein